MADVVRSYENLTNVEPAFCSPNTVDLQSLPSHYRAKKWVRKHTLLCLLSYYVECYLQRTPAPLLFNDESVEAHRSRLHLLPVPSVDPPLKCHH